MLYSRIKELCKERGITITKLENELGFARGSISKIDKHKPSAEKLEKIATFFGMSYNGLVRLIVSQHLRKSTLLSLFVAYLCITKTRNPRHLLSVGDLKSHRACPLVLTLMHPLHDASNSFARP